MAFENDEKEIAQMLKQVRLKSAPDALLKNYEREVWTKIRRPAFPALGIAAACAVFIGAGILIFVLWQTIAQPKRSASPVPSLEAPVLIVAEPRVREYAPAAQPVEPVIPAQAQIQKAAAPEDISEESMDRLAREILVLQWLGEDSGLLDDWDDAPFLAETGMINGKL